MHLKVSGYLKVSGLIATLLLISAATGHFITMDQPPLQQTPTTAPDAGSLSRGAAVAAVSGCKTCHTREGEPTHAYAGGRPINTPFGVIYSPNITPDLATGIGAWSIEDFSKALRSGITPAGQHYFPAFPYTSYAGMSDADVRDLFEFLGSLKPESIQSEENSLWLPFSWRYLQRYWKWLYFQGAVRSAGTETDRGVYLVEVLGHCGECHTPRGWLGGPLKGQHLAGSRSSGKLAPNITPLMGEGLGDWSKGGWTFFLKTGFKPDMDNVQGEMADLIEDGLSRLSDDDRALMAEYLMSLAAKASYAK